VFKTRRFVVKANVSATNVCCQWLPGPLEPEPFLEQYVFLEQGFVGNGLNCSLAKTFQVELALSKLIMLIGND
jgi:hypothetical protein